MTHLLVKLYPSEVSFGVGVLEAKEPDLAEADGLDHLVEQLLAGGRLLDRELQLRVHRRHTDVHLQQIKQLANNIFEITMVINVYYYYTAQAQQHF